MKLSVRQTNFIRISVEVMVILAVISSLVYFSANQSRNEVRDYNYNWTVVQDGVSTKNVVLSEYKFPHIMNEGDAIILHNKVPAGTNNRLSISLLVYLSTVDVYVDNIKIYSYGSDLLAEGKMVGSGYHFIHLPDNAVGKDLKIVICAREDNAFSSIPALEIMPTQSVISSFAREHMVVLFISLFLVGLGIILMLNSLLGILFRVRTRRMVWLGAFSFLIGIWSMGTTKTLQIFSSDLALNTMLEYLSLYLAIIPLLIQMYSLRHDSELWKRVLLWICVFASTMYVVIVSVLHFTNTAHYCKTLGAFHVIMVASLIIIIIAAWKPLKDMNASDQVLNIGFFALFATGGVDLIRFFVQKYLLANDQNLSHSILPLGALIFIIFLIMSYLFYVYNGILEEENRRTLTRLAYHDTLTGLYNRTKYAELLDELSAGEDEYVIVNLDVNGLKKVNDVHGHSQGDLLLKTFAKNLEEVFRNSEHLIRLGGDEFCVIAKGVERSSIEHSLLKLNRLNRDASKKLPFQVTAAYGVAESKEVTGNDAEDVSKLADRRMYDMKTKMKAQTNL